MLTLSLLVLSQLAPPPLVPGPRFDAEPPPLTRVPIWEAPGSPLWLALTPVLGGLGLGVAGRRLGIEATRGSGSPLLAQLMGSLLGTAVGVGAGLLAGTFARRGEPWAKAAALVLMAVSTAGIAYEVVQLGQDLALVYPGGVIARW